jgi:hypothetical protein
LANHKPEGDGHAKLLVVVDHITPGELKAAHDVAEWWREVGHPFPVYFTSEEISDATDVFPLDFLDIAEVRRILYGRDPFEGLNIATHNLRHQLEYELRGKLLRLRTLYVPASHNANKLARLMADSLESFVPLFRHVLRLLGEEAPADPAEALNRLAARLKLEKQTFARIMEYRADEEVWLEAETSETFASYLYEIQEVVEAVDNA